jgi:hypothetical protein
MAFKMKGYNYPGQAPKKSSPVKFDWKNALDNAQTGLTGLGMILGVGNIADAVNTGVSGARAGYAKFKGDTKSAKKYMGDMAINAASMVPGAGLAVGGAKLAAKAAKGTKAANIANKAVRGAEKGEKALAKVYKGNKAGKVKNVASRGRNVADAVTSRAVVGKGKKGAYNLVSGKTAVKASNAGGGVAAVEKSLAQNKKKQNKKNITMLSTKKAVKTVA